MSKLSSYTYQNIQGPNSAKKDNKKKLRGTVLKVRQHDLVAPHYSGSATLKKTRLPREDIQHIKVADTYNSALKLVTDAQKELFSRVETRGNVKYLNNLR